jgi:hypothetical protein
MVLSNGLMPVEMSVRCTRCARAIVHSGSGFKSDHKTNCSYRGLIRPWNY